jgi:hypothetical protein
MNFRPSRNALAAGSLVLFLGWLVFNALMAVRFSFASGDSVIYGLPLAVARHPFDLGIPFIADFEGYGSHWGHQWPGGMWLRGLLFWIVPYSRVADVVVLHLFVGLAALLVFRLVGRAGGAGWPAWLAAALVLSDRNLLLAAAAQRFEPMALACLMVLVFDATGAARGRGWRVLALVAAFLCPLLHPYSLALGALVLGIGLVAPPGTARERIGRMAGRALAFAAGCAAWVLWFALQPEAWRQFLENMALQESFYRNWNTVLAGLTNYRLGGGFVLWGLALVAAIRLAADAGRPLVERLVLPAVLLAVIALHTATRCENYHYLTLGSGPAAALVAILAAEISRRWTDVRRWLPAAALAALLAVHAVIFPYRLLQFQRAGRPDLAGELEGVLAAIPEGRRVFVPPVAWPAAARDRRHEIRFWTFPVVSKREARARYEAAAYAAAKPGDFLVVDRFAASMPDPFGMLPVMPMTPPDAERWQRVSSHRRMFQGAVPWGLDLEVYERK